VEDVLSNRVLHHPVGALHDHPNLLPAYSKRANSWRYVQKPNALARAAPKVTLHQEGNQTIAADGEYGAEGYHLPGAREDPSLRDDYATMRVDHRRESRGIGLREDHDTDHAQTRAVSCPIFSIDNEASTMTLSQSQWRFGFHDVLISVAARYSSSPAAYLAVTQYVDPR